jgi:DNA topoisomerase IB
MPIRIERQLKVWGDSEIQRWYKAITNSETLAASIIEGVHQANVDVVAVEGLTQLLATKDGDQKAVNRFMLMDQCKSMLNMSIIDANDTFTRNSFPFSGLPDIYRIFLEVLSAATDIPITRLLGSSPGGLTATGESDTRNYYDMIKSMQINELDNKLYDIDQVLIRSALGTYPEGIEFEFNSLWQMTPEEEATLRQTNAITIATLQSIGVPEYVLMRDAVEMGLTQNLTIEDIDKMEAADDFDVDDGNDDFLPPSDDGESNGIDQGYDISNVMANFVLDEVDFKEEKHKRDKGGKFSSTGSGGGAAQKAKSVSGRIKQGVLNSSIKHSGGNWKHESGDNELPEHISTLRIPPAWTDVKYSSDPSSDVLVSGKDVKGRVQRIYSKEFTERSSREKFERISNMLAEISEIDEQNRSAFEAGDENASAFELIRRTGLRPGSDVDTKAKKKAYGATTLEGRHVVEENGKVVLKFTGKKGVDLSIPINNDELSEMLLKRKADSGENGRLFSTNAAKLRAYAKTLGSGTYKVKDLRTLVGTKTASDEVAKITEKPKNMDEYKSIVKQVAKVVSQKLGNTPTIALQSYINPTVFDKIKV